MCLSRVVQASKRAQPRWGKGDGGAMPSEEGNRLGWSGPGAGAQEEGGAGWYVQGSAE